MVEKMRNLDLWNAVSTIDPKFTKQITGRPYKGTSPNPQYLVQLATEKLGPCGAGWGWDVLADEFQPLGNEVLHWCRIRFWHGTREQSFDVYGQTRAFYTTNNGKALVDEDAPKKSLTDALVKALSYLGFAADIFLGRYDDQKYVAEVNAEYRAQDRLETEEAAAQAEAQYIDDARQMLINSETKEGFEETCRTIRDRYNGWSNVPKQLSATIATKRAELEGKAA